jgi:hypothetical protein
LWKGDVGAPPVSIKLCQVDLRVFKREAMFCWAMVSRKRMSSKGQEQKVGEGGTAIQAAGNVTITGLSYSEVRAAALDVFEANFYKLAGIAQETANSI